MSDAVAIELSAFADAPFGAWTLTPEDWTDSNVKYLSFSFPDGGASATVFGARGASNFLSKSTKWLAITFFVISLFMAWYATHSSARGPVQQDLGVMD